MINTLRLGVEEDMRALFYGGEMLAVECELTLKEQS
jgi:hypothetical protein